MMMQKFWSGGEIRKISHFVRNFKRRSIPLTSPGCSPELDCFSNCHDFLLLQFYKINFLFLIIVGLLKDFFTVFGVFYFIFAIYHPKFIGEIENVSIFIDLRVFDYAQASKNY